MDFLVVVPVYNAGPWITRCLQSLQAQTVTTWTCRVIDDASTDDTFEVARAAVRGDARFQVVRNASNRGALQNLRDGFAALGSAAHPEAVCVTLDGDDWLAREDALAIVERAYASGDVWLTYGSFIEHPSGQRSWWSGPFPPVVVLRNMFRDYPWQSTSLRTFKAHLWNRLTDADLVEPETGEAWRVTWDLAMMFPMLELAGARHAFVPEAIYVYNRENPLSDVVVRRERQLSAERRIRALPRRTLVPYTRSPPTHAWSSWMRWASALVPPQVTAVVTRLASKARAVESPTPAVASARVGLISCLMLTTPERAGVMADAVRSFDLQTYPTRELVVVTERAHLAAWAPNVRVVVAPAGLSIGAKRNVGVAQARGTHVAVWDDDDFSMPERLATQASDLERTGAVHTRTDRHWLADENLHVTAEIRRLCYGTALFAREAWTRAGGFPDTSFGEDFEFAMRLMLRGLKCRTTEDLFYVRRRHDLNATGGSVMTSPDAFAASVVSTDVAAVNARLAALLRT
jgi:glycosyltransferase involved in cell wall biosynthesis